MLRNLVNQGSKGVWRSTSGQPGVNQEVARGSARGLARLSARMSAKEFNSQPVRKRWNHTRFFMCNGDNTAQQYRQHTPVGLFNVFNGTSIDARFNLAATLTKAPAALLLFIVRYYTISCSTRFNLVPTGCYMDPLTMG